MAVICDCLIDFWFTETNSGGILLTTNSKKILWPPKSEISQVQSFDK